jgi:hypothetical protein
MPKRNLLLVAAGIAVLVSVAATAFGQNRRTPPSGSEGARMPQRKPDLNGIWQVLTTAAVDIQDHEAQLNLPAGLGVVEGHDIPYRLDALAMRRSNHEKRETADPNTKCYLPGVPRATYLPFPFQISQSDRYIAISYEYAHASRLIYLDDSPHPKEADFWMGDSRGHWEGETLVVDVANFNDQTWFDHSGNFHSEALHVVERYTKTGANTITYEAAIDDPKVFTRVWKMKMPLYRRLEPDVRLLEYECVAEAQERLYAK